MSFDDLYDDNVKTFGKHDVLTFGKHKGETVGEVLQTDPKYLKWAFDNVDWFNLEDEVLEVLL